MSQTIRLTEDGDTELWVISEEDWSLPVYAHPYKNGTSRYFRIAQAVPFNDGQFEAADRILSMRSIMPYDSGWIVPETDFWNIASKATGITPARYLNWGKKQLSLPNQIMVPKADVQQHGINSAFLKYVNHQYRLTATNAQLRYIWFVICTEIPKWLHHKQKTIDFGFAKLDALPYRSNWKQILLAKFPKFSSLIKKFRKMPAFMANLALTDFPSEMRRSDLASMKKEENLIDWCLEITPSKSWDEFVQDSEARLMTENGATSYVSYWRTRIDKAETRIIEIFKAFVQSTTRPCAAIRRLGRSRRILLVPTVPRGTIHQLSVDRGSDAVVTEDAEGTPQRYDIQPDVVQENEVMPEMSVIRFEPEKLRLCSGNN